MILETGRFRTVYDELKARGVHEKPLKGVHLSDWRELDYVPVRSALGVPRFMPQVREFPFASKTAPWGLLNKGYSKQEFRDRYLARLERDKDLLRNQLLAIDNDQRPARKPLRLLCYEDLTKEGEWCHRQLFAWWWRTTFGDEVTEKG